ALFAGRLNFATFVESIAKATRASSWLALIIIGATVFGYAMALTQTTQSLVAFIGSLDLNAYVVITAIVVLLLLMGCVLDQTAVLVLSVPILVPVIVSLGFDPVWFGVIVVVLAEVG